MKNFNELFKKKLEEQQFDGKEKYWTQLEKKLNEAAQEKVVIAWYKKWLLPVIAVIAIGATALLFTKKNIHNADLANKETKLPSAPEAPVSTHTNNTTVLTNNTIQTQPPAAINNATTKINTELNSPENNTPVSSNKEVNTVNQKRIHSNKLNISNVTNASSKPANKVSVVNEIAPSKNNTSSAKEPIISTTEADEIESYEVSAQAMQTSLLTTPEATQHKTEAFISPAASIVTAPFDFRNAAMPLAFISPKGLSALIYPETSMNLATDLALVTPVKTKNSIRLSVYGGAMYSMKNLLTSDGNTSDYLNRRKTGESNAVKPNAGLDVELKRGHWTLTSGVNFHQQGEKRTYSDEFKRIVPYDSLVININNNSAWLVDSTVFYALHYNSIITSYDTTVTYYDEASGLYYTAQLPVNLNQNTTVDTNYYYLIDSTYYSATDTIKTTYALKKQVVIKDPDQANLKGRNTFSYIEIPLLVGYEWGIRRWRLSVKAGMGIGMLTRQQSFYLTTDEAEVAPVSTDVYTKVMYNAILRAGLHYNFTPAFGIDIVPFSRFNINTMTNKNAPFRQKYGNAGLQVGFSYTL